MPRLHEAGEMQEVYEKIAEKDAEIAQIKAQKAQALEIYNEALAKKDELIIVLADALDISTKLFLVSDLPVDVVNNKISENELLQKRAKEAAATRPDLLDPGK